MKKILSFFFTLTVFWTVNLLSVSNVFLTNNTDIDFDINIAQTAGDPLPGWTGNRDAVNYKGNKVAAYPNFPPNTKIYSIPRSSNEAGATINPNKTYCFGVQLNHGKSYIGFNQKLTGVKKLVPTELCHSAGASYATPAALQDTQATGKRLMLWHDETVKKDICALYDRRTSFLGDDDIYITLSNVGTGRDVCPAPDPVNIVPCPGPACGQ